MRKLKTRFGVLCFAGLLAGVIVGTATPAPEDSPTVRAVVVGARATRAERVAADYLVRFLSAGTTQTVKPVTSNTPMDRSVVIAGHGTRRTMSTIVSGTTLERLGDEGFAILQQRQPRKRFVVVVGATDRGVLYGTFDLARRIGVGENPWSASAMEQPAFPFRCLWSWSRPTARNGAFFNYDEMAKPAGNPRYQRFGELLATMHINAFCFWGDYGEREGGPPEPLEKTRLAYRNFTEFLKRHYGVDSYVFMFYGRGDDLAQLCVHNEAVRKRWRGRVENLLRLYPHVKGIVMAGAGGDWVRAPWECRCEECVKHTDRQLLLAAMEMIGEPLRERGGRLIWKAVTDRPTRVKSEVEHFGGLTGVVPDYVSIAFKTFYKDFRPPHPYNPQFFQLEVDPPAPVPYVTEFQILGEYRGLDQFPCSMAERWAPIFRMAEKRRQHGVIGVISAEPGPSIDHPLNGINWYAFGRWSWNAREPLDRVMSDWARLEFGGAGTQAIVSVLQDSYPASTKMMFAKGVMTQDHSRLPSINHELESSLVGPWHDMPRAPEGEIGRAHDLSMYPPEVAGEILEDPSLVLFTRRRRLTLELAEELNQEKREAVGKVQRMMHTWKSLEGVISDEKYHTVMQGLQDNLVDAELWRRDLKIYLDYKLGRQTKDRLVRSLQRIRRDHPDGGSTLTAGKPLERFLSEWEAVLDGSFKRRVMEGEHYTPPVSDFPPGLAKPE